ncbi:hypothetical protein KSP39_PZI013681 [Platanthera zijinensis]|uniref:No apical meristem-associated C-terminal domain-containing protein n=1 Tax=Platanthera zijinensis TaxID=2320716 RepID=A0AAP0BCA8_9ASPA
MEMSGSTKNKNSPNINMSQTLSSNTPSQGRGIDLNSDNNNMNLGSTGDEESPISTSNKRPTGRKQEKERRRQLSGKGYDIETHTKKNEEILEVLKRGQEQRANDMSAIQELMRMKAENQKRKLDLQSAKQDHDIMMIDLDSIKGTPERQYFRQKK